MSVLRALKAQQQQQSNYQRSAQNVSTSSASSRWFGDLGSSFSSNVVGGPSNMNVMNDFIQSSPSMSPNNNNSINNPMDDSRKAPPPIGTERHNFNKYNSNCYQQYPMTQNDMDFSSVPSSMMNQIGGMPPNNSWMDKNPQQQWQMQSNVPVAPRNNNPYDTNDYNMTPDLFQVSSFLDCF